jgi:malate synthase
VDRWNKVDPFYRPVSGREEEGLAFQAARALIVEGLSGPMVAPSPGCMNSG